MIKFYYYKVCNALAKFFAKQANLRIIHREDYDYYRNHKQYMNDAQVMGYTLKKTGNVWVVQYYDSTISSGGTPNKAVYNYCVHRYGLKTFTK